MPTLIVLRHAKAAAGPGLADIERPLTERGRRDAAAAGEWLRADGRTVPGLVLCSTAVRTRETLGLLALDAEVSHEPRIYGNDADDLLALIRETAAREPEPRMLLLIGHNPSVHQLVHDLTGNAPDSFPTCALAVVELPGDWAGVRRGTGELVTFRTPKD
ncbi:SixA phosphatase family protein [Actinomadura xylanilytica]|uniref:SixA phosphatase family protein n=1 Tax=Actinomadura xylanilytica TaxID=887459 RepID=UPI00255B0E39|nr:histidine phosphatase family protein [Actinomadura xylanilytica]MDL4773342.1 histidine phosphatase family protein [Actinomadura xylanilytica]